MTTNDPILDQPLDFPTGGGPTITSEMSFYLQSTAKWGRFLAIVGFIMSGLLAIVGLVVAFFISTLSSSLGSDLGPLPSFGWAGIGFFYLILGGIYFLPCWYQLQMSNNLLKAINTDNEFNYTEAFRYQKALYRFFGIFTIILLSLYPLFGILGVLISL